MSYIFRILPLCLTFTAMFATLSFGIVPATYKGKPYGGRPYAIPGRINFTSYDLGGPNVAWKCDNQAGSYGSSAGPRANDGETAHPGFYVSNNSPSEQDRYTDGSVFPSASDSNGCWYIGAAHATDWVGVTIKVAKAGNFWISTTAACDPADIKFNITFNDVNKTGTVTLPGSGGYHIWRVYNYFKRVTLDTGVQIMKFTLEEAHMNYAFLVFSTDSAGTGVASLPAVESREQIRLAGALNSINVFTPHTGPADISIINCAGRTMQNVLNGTLSAGEHRIQTDLNSLGRGTYFIQFRQDGNQKTVPILQLR